MANTGAPNLRNHAGSSSSPVAVAWRVSKSLENTPEEPRWDPIKSGSSGMETVKSLENTPLSHVLDARLTDCVLEMLLCVVWVR